MAVGAKLAANAAGTATGAVYLYSMGSSARKLTLTQTLYGSKSADDKFGSGLAVFNDGTRLVVGA